MFDRSTLKWACSLHLRANVYVRDVRHSMSQFPCTDTWLVHPVSCGWNISGFPLPEYVDKDQLNAYVPYYNCGKCKASHSSLIQTEPRTPKENGQVKLWKVLEGMCWRMLRPVAVMAWVMYKWQLLVLKSPWVTSPLDARTLPVQQSSRLFYYYSPWYYFYAPGTCTLVHVPGAFYHAGCTADGLLWSCIQWIHTCLQVQ